jgi:hypothetical protein
MVAYVAPGSLKDRPLVLKARAAGDYNVRINGPLAGRIMLKSVSDGREVWFWTITGPYIPVDMLPSNGGADTLAEAKEAFQAKVDRWRKWASFARPRVRYGRITEIRMSLQIIGAGVAGSAHGVRAPGKHSPDHE